MPGIDTNPTRIQQKNLMDPTWSGSTSMVVYLSIQIRIWLGSEVTFRLGRVSIRAIVPVLLQLRILQST